MVISNHLGKNKDLFLTIFVEDFVVGENVDITQFPG